MLARLVLRVFDGARAWVLESKHMLGSLMLGLDARRVLNKHQGITEWYIMEKITALKAEKSSQKNSRENIWQQKFRY